MLIIFENFVDVIPRGFERRNSLVHSDFPDTGVVSCQSEFDIALENVYQALKI
jgi:hypothetical protein